MPGISEVVARERGAAAAHRASLDTPSVPPPSAAPKDTFLHGFLLPLSLVRATLRDRELRRPYLRVTALRLLVVVVLAAAGCVGGPSKPKTEHRGRPTLIVHHDVGGAKASPSSGVHVHAPGIDVDLDARRGAKSEVKVLGQDVPVVDIDEATEAMKVAEAARDHDAKTGLLASGWAWVLAFVAALSGASTVIVGLSRRHDDWLGFGAAALAHVKPEDETRKVPKICVDVKWIKKKIRERIRESIAFAAGMPVVALLLMVPVAGPFLFKVGTVAWGWYWLGVTTAMKNDHSLADAETAPPPAMVRAIETLSRAHWLLAPLRPYARLLAWATRSFNSPAAFFERTPRAFLGLGLSRALFALPGLYFFGKAIVPVAAGRLCAEADPLERFSVAAGDLTPRSPA